MEIIEAAFTVWGRTVYRTTSLTQLARELGVTKPALYRHFASKEALLDAMYEYYFDTYGAYIKPYMDKAAASNNIVQSLRILVRAMADFNLRNKYIFLFSLMQHYGDGRADTMLKEFRRRGMNIRKIQALEGKSGYPSCLQLALTTNGFFVALFLKDQCRGRDPSDKKIEKIISYMEGKIFCGLGFNKRHVDELDFAALEARLPRNMFDGEADGGLLKAVAGAVAEAGPWNASMDMVARRSGLSKSSLYSHFKSKQDMLGQLFLLEFRRLSAYARASVERGEGPLEQFYLALLAIADYLRSRPEILITMDWVKTRRIELGIRPSKDLLARDILEVFSSIPIVARFDKELSTHWVFYWVLFLIIATLVRCPGGPQSAKKRPLKGAALPNSACRKVFRFIALGVEG